MESELQSLLVQNEREAHDAEEVFDVIKTVKEKMAVIEREIQTVSYCYLVLPISIFKQRLTNLFVPEGKRGR